MYFLRSVLAGAALIWFSVECHAQDVRIRQRAETLLEHANSISTPHDFASYEQTITFRSFTPAGTQQGRFTSVVHGPRSYRDEYEFEAYHLLVVVNGAMIADVGDRAQAPVQVRRMTRLNHPYIVRFDQSDIIRSIQDRQVSGRPAQCIEFDTITGEKSAANEICIDKEFGVLARVHANDETITNSDFFSYRDTFLPAHIVYEQNDLRMELEQTKSGIECPFDPDFLVPPPNARVVGTRVQRLSASLRTIHAATQAREWRQQCRCDGARTVRTDGAIRDASIDVSEREDLNQEALRIFRTWRFTPALCDGEAIEIPADATLHFQNR
jgi:hypothetical protein